MIDTIELVQTILDQFYCYELLLFFLGFVPSGTNSLSKYVKDVNIHFANKVVSEFAGNSEDRF